MGHPNRLRDEVTNAVAERLGWAARNDRKGLVIVVLQLVNAVWFATLWVEEFPDVATAIWCAFFALSAASAIAIEQRR
jgi:hypothetical protein